MLPTAPVLKLISAVRTERFSWYLPGFAGPLTHR